MYAVASAADRPAGAPQEESHLEKWQDPLVISKLFHMVNKECFSHQLLPVERMFAHHPQTETLLEFGCATAPITLSFFEFFRPTPALRFHVADLAYLPFHYGCHRFRQCANVIPNLLKPEDGFHLRTDVRFDVIFCRAVFEHLPDPLRTVQVFFDQLNPGGLLIFDYVMTDSAVGPGAALGLDHAQGHIRRPEVLDFMERNFQLVEGALHRDRSIGLAVLKKR